MHSEGVRRLETRWIKRRGVIVGRGRVLKVGVGIGDIFNCFFKTDNLPVEFFNREDVDNGILNTKQSFCDGSLC